MVRYPQLHYADREAEGVGKTGGQSRSRECWEQRETVDVGQGDAAEAERTNQNELCGKLTLGAILKKSKLLSS